MAKGATLDALYSLFPLLLEVMGELFEELA